MVEDISELIKEHLKIKKIPLSSYAYVYSKHASAIAKGTETSLQWFRSAACSTGQNCGWQQGLSVAAPRLWNELPLEICSAKTQISFRKKLKKYFLVSLFRLKYSANDFWTMSQITIMFVAPLSSNNRWFGRYRSLLFLL